MSASPLAAALRHIHRLIDEGSAASQGDPRLLARYAEDGDGPAFAALVERHGPMVLATCRAGLSDPGEVEDAFQATFLTLARRAGTVRDAEALGAWLHRVARRVVARANRSASNRRRHERQAGESRPSARPDREEVASALHEEIDRLPDRYRLPVVLCHLEGLTHAEAARRLRRGERTLRRHLAEALPKLRTRLVGRGVALSVPALVALLSRPASASLPEVLLAKTARLAGSGAGPAAVATLAGRALLGPGAFHLKVASTVAAGLIASAFLARSVLALNGADDSAMKKAPGAVAAAVPSPAPPDGKPEGSWTFAGRVVDPDGRPFAGAKLYLDHSIDEKDPRPPLRATSGPDGRFRFAIAKAGSGIEPDGNIFEMVHVAAVAEGFGLGVSDGPEPDADRDLTVRLAKDDVPIVGRLIDLEGRPVVGANVRVETFWAPDSNELTAWIAGAKADAQSYGRYNCPANHLARVDFPPGAGLIEPAISGADGRFRLAGVGRERLVELAVSGPSIRETKVTAMTRTGPSFLSPEDRGPMNYTQQVHNGATFEIIVPPSRTIEGMVRDVETGRPVAGAVLYDIRLADDNVGNSHLTQAISGPDGRYRLEGLPRGSGNVIEIAPPQDQPYLASSLTIGDAAGLGALKIDIPLKRGVWATGRVVDKATNKPFRFASVRYFASRQNPQLGEAPGFREIGNYGNQGLSSQADAEGVYRVAVLPGRGLLSASVNDGRHSLLDPDPGLTDLAPIYTGYDHGRRVIDAPESGELAGIDFAVDSGRTLAGTVLGPDERPLAGFRAYGTGWLGAWDPPSRSDGFSVDGLKPPLEGTPEPEKALALIFRHDEKRLAGWRDVRWDEPGPLKVRLEPWAEVVGRVVDASGKPRRKVAIRAYAGGGRKRRGSGLIEHQDGMPAVTDLDGRFRLEGLAPGLPYQIQLDYADGARWLDLPAEKPGGTADLGILKTDGEAN